MKQDKFKLKNYRAFIVKYLSPTNSRGARVKINDPRFEASKIISYNYEFNSAADTALEYLNSIGIEIAGQCDNEILFTADFNTALT